MVTECRLLVRPLVLIAAQLARARDMTIRPTYAARAPFQRLLVISVKPHLCPAREFPVPASLRSIRQPAPTLKARTFQITMVPDADY